MSDAQKAHELKQGDQNSVGTGDVVFDCPHCHKSLVVDKVAAGHDLNCPTCGKTVKVPEIHRVVTLQEAPETKALQAKPAWEQELTSIESALGETRNQREEAGNFYKKHVSDANRQQLRIEKLDAKLKELDTRKKAILAEHPES